MRGDVLDIFGNTPEQREELIERNKKALYDRWQQMSWAQRVLVRAFRYCQQLAAESP